MIKNAKSSKVIFMSGTPMANDPYEIVPCINMLHGKEILLDDYNYFVSNYLTERSLLNPNIDVKNMWDLQNRAFGTVSYSAGDKSNFPTEHQT